MKKLKAIKLNEKMSGILDERLTWLATEVYSKFINKNEIISLKDYYDIHDDLFEGLENLNQIGYVYYFVEKDLYLLFNEPVDIKTAEKVGARYFEKLD